MMRIAAWVGAAAVSTFVALAPGARAASFDCGKAASPEERAICQMPSLSDMDGKIANAYHATSQRLSPAGQRVLGETQKQWNEATSAACAPLRDDPARLPGCLELPYRLRLQDLIDPIQTIGAFTFLRVGVYGFVPCMDSFGCDGTYHTGGYVHASHPRIDMPATDEIQEWNRLVVDKLPPFEGALQPNTTVTLDYRISGVSADMISVRFQLDEYSHRATHGSVFISAFNTTLPTGQPIMAADLFADGTAWREFLYRQATRKVRADLVSSGVNQDAQILTESLRDIVQKPERWALTPAGLAIMLGPYDLGFYVESPRDAVIPWADLKPYLRNPLPFQLPQ